MSLKSYLIIASLTFTCAQNTLAMRCNAIKAFKFARKTNQYKALSFCTKPTTSNDASDDLKRLQELYERTESINRIYSSVFTENALCLHRDSCCRLAKEDTKQAWAGKEIRLAKNSEHREARLIESKHHLLLLEQNSIDLQKIFLASPDKVAITALYEELCNLIIDMAECRTYTVNIYGACSREELILALFQERRLHELAAARAATRKGESWKLLNIPTVSIPIDGYTPEERLQAECNAIYERIMKSHGRKINNNILLGWEDKYINPHYIMQPSEVIKWSRAWANLQENNQ